MSPGQPQGTAQTCSEPRANKTAGTGPRFSDSDSSNISRVLDTASSLLGGSLGWCGDC